MVWACERIDEYRMARRVFLAEESGGRIWRRPRLGWMDGVKVATEEWRWRLSDNARKIGQSEEPWYICNWISFTRPFLLGPVFFRTALPCSGGYHREGEGCRYIMRLGWTGERAKLLKIKEQVSSIWANESMIDHFMRYLTCHDWTSLVVGESRGIYIIIIWTF